MTLEEKNDNLITENNELKDKLRSAQDRFAFWQAKTKQREQLLSTIKTNIGANLEELWNLTDGDEIMDKLISESKDYLERVWWHPNPLEP